MKFIYIKKYWWILLIFMFSIFIIPFLIDWAYTYGFNRKQLIISNYSPSDILQFWGMVLSFFGTMTLGLVAYMQNNKLHIANKKLEEKRIGEENYPKIKPSSRTLLSILPVENHFSSLLYSYENNLTCHFIDSILLKDVKNDEIDLSYIEKNKERSICLAVQTLFLNDADRAAIWYKVHNGIMRINIKEFDDIYILLEPLKRTNKAIEKDRVAFIKYLPKEIDDQIEKENIEYDCAITMNIYLDKQLWLPYLSKVEMIELVYSVILGNLNISSEFRISTTVKFENGLINRKLIKDRTFINKTSPASLIL